MHILHTPMREVTRDRLDEKWCFKCHKRRPFELIVTVPIVVSWCDLDTRQEEVSTGAYYGPSPRIECAFCHTVDGDCFPGRTREWEVE